MKKLNRSIQAKLALVLALALLVAACAEGEGGSTTAPSESGTTAPVESGTTAPADSGTTVPPDSGDAIGPAESGTVTVAAGFPELQAYLRYIAAIDEGFFEEEGLTVEVVGTDDNRAALISGSVDIASVGTGTAFQAAREDLGIVAIASENCRDDFTFAVQPGVESVEELAGEDVLVTGSAGDSSLFPRKQVLAENGWDLDSLDPPVSLVNQPGGSEAWQELFLAERIHLMPFFPDNYVAMREYGANPIVSELRPWPGDLLMANAEWVEANPNTVARFLRAVMRASEFSVAPGIGEPYANKDRIIEIGQNHGFDTTAFEATDNPYALGTNIWCVNLTFSEEVWDTMIDVLNEDAADFDNGAVLAPLLAAQESLGLDNSAPGDVPWPPEFIIEWREEVGQ